jgi:hypothetical protein
MTEGIDTPSPVPPRRTSTSIIDAIDKLSYSRKGLALLMTATQAEGEMDHDHLNWAIDHILGGVDEARAVLDAELDALRAADPAPDFSVEARA